LKKELKLIQMSNVEVEQVHWVWYPYIPYGKITVVQGDPGEGKTTFVLALIALLTQGKPLPEEENGTEPINVITKQRKMVLPTPSSLVFCLLVLTAKGCLSLMKMKLNSPYQTKD
jgi:energy-coupling factor transporter ATP-binding protein EcfA2